MKMYFASTVKGTITHDIIIIVVHIYGILLMVPILLSTLY